MILLRNKMKKPSILILFMYLTVLIGLLLFILCAFSISLVSPLGTYGQIMLMTLTGSASGGVASGIIERIVFDWRKEHWKKLRKESVQFKRDTTKLYNEIHQGKHNDY